MKLKDIKKDQIFWECEAGRNMRMVAQEDARTIKTIFGTDPKEIEQYICKVKLDTGTICELLATEGYEHYGPRLYDSSKYY